MADADYTLAELCIAACAEAWRGDGEILASPIGVVPRISAGVARLTFEPDLLLTDGQASLMSEPTPIGAEPDPTRIEGSMTYARVFDAAWFGRRHVMMGAAQIDRFGNTNISCIGDLRRPKKQLLGVRGAPGNSINHACSYWVPAHTRRTFVEHVDMVSGLGYEPQRWSEISPAFHEVRYIVTNLAVLDFKGPDHTPRIVSIHPGVSLDEIQENTGFEFAVPDDLAPTPGPAPEALRLIREVLDPDGRRAGEVAERA
jgi:acyl CoA:acetate/3-ketoacid CoA transferase beta subunit